MAIEKTVDLNVNASEGIKALEKFGLTAERLEKEDLQPLNFAIGELEDRLYEMASAGDTSSRLFVEMSEEVARMKKVIIDTDMVLDGMSQTAAQKVGGSIGGLASGFELAQGAMATFGVESSQVEEALLKVQSAMAISQGFQGIREAIPSFRGLASSVKLFSKNTLSSVKALSTFKKALIGTGIGAIIVLLGELIANWDKYKKLLEDFSLTVVGDLLPAQQKNIEQIKETKKLATEQLKVSQDKLRSIEAEIQALKSANGIETKKFDDAIRLAQAEGKSKEEIEKIERKRLKFIIESAETELELQKQKAFALRDEILAKAALGQLDEETKKNALDALRTQIETTKETYQTLQSARVDLEVFNAEKETEKREMYKESAKQRLDEEKQLNDELARIREEEILRQIEEEEELSEAIRTAKLTAQEKEIEDVNTHYFNLIERAKQYGLDTQALEEEQNAKIKEINDKYQAEIDAKNQEQKDQDDADREERLQKELDLQNAKFEAASITLDSISGLVSAFAGESEAQQRRAFNIQKAVNIAQAIMDTYKGANAIFANAAMNPTSVLFPAQPFIMAGAAITAGLANVATIAKQKFEGGGSASTGGASTSGVPNLGGSVPPTFNVVGNTGVNQLAETLGSSPMQAYVVAGDVTTAQSLERNKIEQSTL